MKNDNTSGLYPSIVYCLVEILAGVRYRTRITAPKIFIVMSIEIAKVKFFV